ncbi:MAG: hypothetical protein HY319_00150, partial [Armatimonadetes bacterium]|nr:hypothetical protein [Armatimonadota bacterium]
RKAIAGRYRWQSTSGEPLVFADGLSLEGASLYVEGDLVIKGGVHGRGAVFVTGKTVIEGGSELASRNLAAVLSRGDVRVLGNGQDGSFFNGLVYSKGEGGFDTLSPGLRGALSELFASSPPSHQNILGIAGPADTNLDLVIQDSTVVGAAINVGRGVSGDGGRMFVEEARVVYAQESVQFQVVVDEISVDLGGIPALVVLEQAGYQVTVPPIKTSDIPVDPGPPARYVWDNALIKWQVVDPQGNVAVYDSADQLPVLGPAQKRALERRAFEKALSQFQSQLGNVTPPADPRSSVSLFNLDLDLNQFLSEGANLKVLLWRPVAR